MLAPFQKLGALYHSLEGFKTQWGMCVESSITVVLLLFSGCFIQVHSSILSSIFPGNTTHMLLTCNSWAIKSHLSVD